MFAVTTMCGLHASLCLDLVLVLMKPFSPKESRTKYYIGVSVAFGLIQSSFAVFFKSSWDSQNWAYFVVSYLALILVLIVWITSFGSIIYASLKLCKTSISQQTRKLMMARHIVCIVSFTLSNIYIQAGCVFYAVTNKSPYTTDYDGALIMAMKISLGAQGLYLPLTRFFEPYFYTILASKVKYLRCPCRNHAKQDKMQDKLDD